MNSTVTPEPMLARWIFSARPLLLMLFALLTLFLGHRMTQVVPDASFDKMVPTSHPYIAKFLQHRDDLSGLGNAIRVAVETTEEDIFSAEFMGVLQQVNDDVFFLPGVDRSGLKSIWTPNVRWNEVTEQGLAGGTVIPDGYDGSQASLDKLKQNVLKSSQVGALVANNFKSAIIYAPLSDVDPNTGEKLNYQQFSSKVEQLIRDKYQSATIKIHVTGFAIVVGELINGAGQVAMFFAAAVIITLVLLYLYCRCIKSSVVALLCSLVAVIWQLGILNLLGYGLDPYSMLVPFLVFAIGVSHGVQLVNAIVHEVMSGKHRFDAAKAAFVSLYVAGLTALVSDGIGFITLMVIDIQVIQDLAVAASIGVAAIILTNLVLLPLLISYLGVSHRAVDRLQRQEESTQSFWRGIAQFSRRPMALVSLGIMVLLFAVAWVGKQGLIMGDLDAGAPELRADSRYNQDNAFMVANYSASTDRFVVMVETADDYCVSYETLNLIDRFQWHMENVPGVQSVISISKIAKYSISALNEGSLKWMALSRNQYVLNQATSSKAVPPGMINGACSLVPVIVYLDDHKAQTLARVVDAAQQFAAANNNERVAFELAAGNAGIEAATNIVIEKAQYQMLAWVYGVVSLLCFITFRSLRTVVCIILPLALTSLLCQALMAWVGIGIKVATLPVIALGVGIGVDYGIYIYAKLTACMKQGMALSDAYFSALKTTGKAVAFTGITLAIGVGTWVLSPIKFQADMGVLLTFMFLWNMVGALVFLPALTWLLNRNLGQEARLATQSNPA